MNYREENLILIVDTDRTFCDSTSRCLVEAGYKTVVAYDGIQAQILLNELKPHLVVLDIEIPGKGALDIVNQACRMGFTVPVIMTAAQSSRVSGLPMEQKGAVDFLAKPLNREVFLQKIKNALQKTKTARDNTLSSVQQKLDDLSLISSYSEKLLPLVDENEVIRCLFTTVQKYFNLDVVGVLIARKRNHVFLYWSKGQAAETAIRKICSEIIEEYNRAARTKVSLKRVGFKQFLPSVAAATCIDAAPPFRHIVALVGEAFDYGAMYFGSCLNGAEFQGRLALLSSIASQTRIALTNSKLYNDMKENYIRTIKALAIAVDAKDTYTHGHSENVMNIAEELARELGLETGRVGSIRDAGLLHDIGKIGVPGYILNKAGTLTYEEFNGIMKTHSSLGANIVKDVPFLQDLFKLILYHHENFDGSGYPEGFKGEEIPIGARIIHVADAFEAMTSNRPYRSSLGKDEAVKRLIEGSGKQFDPAVIDAFMRLARRKGWLSSPGAQTATAAV